MSSKIKSYADKKPSKQRQMVIRDMILRSPETKLTKRGVKRQKDSRNSWQRDAENSY